MAKGKRNHLSYERMALLVEAAPAFKSGDADMQLNEIQRIQNISYSFNYNAQQLREIGSSEYIKDRSINQYGRIPVVSQPQVQLSFDYLLYDGENEKNIGFDTTSSDCIFENSFLYKPTVYNDKNPEIVKGDVNFLVLAEESSHREDVVGRPDGAANLDGVNILGFGNCYLSNYSLSAAVGELVDCSVSYDCSNMQFDVFDHASPPHSPAVDSKGQTNQDKKVPENLNNLINSGLIDYSNSVNEHLVLRPGDIEIILTNNNTNEGFRTIDLGNEGIAIQSINVELAFDRQDINGFGSNYIKDRKLSLPIFGSIDLSVITRNFEARQDIDLSEIFKNDIDYDMQINLYVASANFTGKEDKKTKVVEMLVKHAKLNSESHTNGIGEFSAIDASFLFEVTPDSGFVFKQVSST
jgi:hypothetical protein